VWNKLPVIVRAIICGFLIAMVAANVWPLLLLKLGVPIAAPAEALFLAAYLWFAAHRPEFRKVRIPAAHWGWGFIAALSFAATVHAAIVVLFRLVPYPLEAFRHGYDFSFIPTQPLRWIAVVLSAASAGICEETGFRGYMQWPIEQRHGIRIAILISSTCFTLVHLTKDWATLGMVPIVLGAGALLGMLAWASQSLVFCIIGHTVMDVGLFAYWWTGIAGSFQARPISETGIDSFFVTACAALALFLATVLLAIRKLSRAAASLR